MGRPPPLSSFFSPPVFVLRFLPFFSWETAGRSTWGGFMRKIGSGIAYKDFPGPLLPGFFPFFCCGLLLIPGVTNISALHAIMYTVSKLLDFYFLYAKRTLAMLFKTNLFGISWKIRALLPPPLLLHTHFLLLLWPSLPCIAFGKRPSKHTHTHT